MTRDLRNYERFVGLKEEGEDYELVAEVATAIKSAFTLAHLQIPLNAGRTASKVIQSTLSGYTTKFQPIN